MNPLKLQIENSLSPICGGCACGKVKKKCCKKYKKKKGSHCKSCPKK